MTVDLFDLNQFPQDGEQALVGLRGVGVAEQQAEVLYDGGYADVVLTGDGFLFVLLLVGLFLFLFLRGLLLGGY